MSEEDSVLSRRDGGHHWGKHSPHTDAHTRDRESREAGTEGDRDSNRQTECA